MLTRYDVRTWLVRLSVFAVALGFAETSVEAGTGPSRPSVVIILCDDLGYGDLGCFGNPEIQTPRLDRLAAEGLKLTRCYSAQPVCSPSRAGLLTGRNPNRLGIRDWVPERSNVHLRGDEITIPELLKTAGYHTAHVGKWHASGTLDGTQPTPGDQGFDHWFSTQNNAAPSHHDPVNFVRNGKPVGPMKGESSTLIVDEAITFLNGLPAGDPFAVFVWFHAPHEPVATPEAYTSLYASDPEATRRIYKGSVSLIDHEVGRLVDHLDAKGLGANTLVVFTSDNGPETLNRYRGAERSHGSPGPLRGMKLHVHEGGYRVPGIIRWTGHVAAGRTSDEAVCGLDLLPTICDLAGVGPPKDRALDGQSIVKLLDGATLGPRKPLFWQYDVSLSRPLTLSYLDGRLKLLADPAFRRFELYDLDSDTSEARDLASERPADVERLARGMKAAYDDVNGTARNFPPDPPRAGPTPRKKAATKKRQAAPPPSPRA
jgi:arylsulfatase A